MEQVQYNINNKDEPEGMNFYKPNYESTIDFKALEQDPYTIKKKVESENVNNFYKTNYESTIDLKALESNVNYCNKNNKPSLETLSNLNKTVRYIQASEVPDAYRRSRKRTNMDLDMRVELSNRVEILNAARGLFSKRTRTLYHWMYPGASKQYIKNAVAAAWESLGNEEKDFYVSQVLGKFGYPYCNLMVNPQLDGMKELPTEQVPETVDSWFDLQKAMSNISGINNPQSIRNRQFNYQRKYEKVRNKKSYHHDQNTEYNGMYYPGTDPDEMRNKSKRKGRPLGSRNRKDLMQLATTMTSQEFMDDPELRTELEHFYKYCK